MQSPVELHHTSDFQGVSSFGGGGEGTPHHDTTKPSQHASLPRGRDVTLTLLIAGAGHGRCAGSSAHLAVHEEVSPKVNS